MNILEERDYIETEFSYTDEFGQLNKLSKKLSTTCFHDCSCVEVLLEEFKCFLLASGFTNKIVDKITYVD